MPRTQIGALLEFLRSALGARCPGDPTDADLLERFADRRDEEAFATLLQRHGPLVLNVCRRVLDNAEDADDAFQATFLVLVRKAVSIRKGGSLASWLHGVALRVALEARTRAARRRAHEQQGERPGHADPGLDVAARELRSILDEELEHLPSKYRAPLVLHYLAGKTKDETARQLGWSEGTVSGRLARARDLLRNRLVRRGLLPSGGVLATAFASQEAHAAVSAVLAETTLKAAALFAAGEVAAGAGAARVVALTERVVRTMYLSKLKIATAVLLLATAVGLGAGGLIYRPPAGQSSAEQKDPPLFSPAPARQDPASGLKGEPAQVKKTGTVVRAPGSFTLVVALTADGKLLARGGADHTIDLWDAASGKKLHTLKGHTVPILRLAFSPDGKTLASITGTWLPDDVPTEVKLWDVATGKERVAVQGHPTRGLALAFSPDGKTLATSSNTVKLWDVATGKEKLELLLPKGTLPWSLAFSPDGKTLATGTGGSVMGCTPSSVILWEVATGKENKTLPGHPNSITWVGFSPDGKTLASASGGSFDPHKVATSEPPKLLPGQLKLWDVATAKERITIPLQTATPLQFFDLVFTKDGKTLISATASFGAAPGEGGLAVQHWEAATGKARATYWAPINAGGPPGAGTNAGVFFAALSADGQKVAWGGAEKRDEKITGTGEIWDVQSLAHTPPRLPKEIRSP
jgi:RNA polymerase sigma factor (sigma-70 family)